MTFVAGFKCSDGVVLCADRLESDGVTKRYRYKLEGIDQNGEWGVSWGCAGDGHVIDKFTEKFKASLMALRDFNLSDIQLSAEAVLVLVNTDYPGHTIQIAVGVWNRGVLTKSSIRVAKALLYRGNSQQACLAPEPEYTLCGMDVTLAECILRNTFKSGRTSVDEAIRLGITVTALMKNYAEGVGGPTDVIYHKRGTKYWEELSQEQITAIEASTNPDDLERAIGEWWKAKREPSK
jgi:hypothetical protein